MKFTPETYSIPDRPMTSFIDSEEIWNEVSSLAPTLTGISYARIDKVGIQWPCDDADHPGTKFLHGDGFPIGKAKLVAIDYLPPAEVPDADYPFMLTTGRRLSTYHTGTQTGRAKHFDRLVDQEYLELNPHDASALGVVDNEMDRQIAGIQANSVSGVFSVDNELNIVDSGKPTREAASTTAAPAVWAVKPCAGSILMMRVPIVRMIRQPPA